MSDTTTTPAEQTETTDGYGSKGYRAYVLFALIVVYTFNFIDRSLVGVLAEPIRETFGLDDFTMGMLSGPAFAIMYTLLGIPFAMLAERRSRTWIIAWAMAAWSAMTAACGIAQNATQFALARVGVGIGEAGCSTALALPHFRLLPTRETLVCARNLCDWNSARNNARRPWWCLDCQPG